MAIDHKFLIKHVRPITEKGYEFFASQQLIDVLLKDLRVSDRDVRDALGLWRKTAGADPHSRSDAFTDAARAVSVARWGELYQTDASTVMFLNAEQIAELSAAGGKAPLGQPIAWRPKAKIAVAVTLNKSGSTHVVWGAAGCDCTAYIKGSINHFSALLST